MVHKWRQKKTPKVHLKSQKKETSSAQWEKETNSAVACAGVTQLWTEANNGSLKMSNKEK